MKTALIFGATGQDGTYLTMLLVKQGYKVVGICRPENPDPDKNLRRIGFMGDIEFRRLSLASISGISDLFKLLKPNLAVNLVGQSSVNVSFYDPVSTFKSNIDYCFNILEGLRLAGTDTRLINAASSEIFGNRSTPANENSLFNPVSIYGISKANSIWLTDYYRDIYGLRCFSLIMGNHESLLRPSHFVIKKIADYLVSGGYRTKRVLSLGNIEVIRDWGYAPEYMSLIPRIAESDFEENMIIATGRSLRLRSLLEWGFSRYSVDYREHVESAPTLSRPRDITSSFLDPSRAFGVLGWRAEWSGYALLGKLIEDINNPGLIDGE